MPIKYFLDGATPVVLGHAMGVNSSGLKAQQHKAQGFSPEAYTQRWKPLRDSVGAHKGTSIGLDSSTADIRL
jgi:hypothetical protein